MTGALAGASAQPTVDEAYRGRVVSIWAMLAMGGPAIGAVIVGVLGETW